MFYPDIDLSRVDSGKRILGGQFVASQAEELFGIVTSSRGRSP